MEILRSPLRRKLLIYYFTHPDVELYLREIAEIIQVDPGNLSKEMRKLEKDGIFKSRERGKQKYFSLNKEYFIYKELRSIIFKKIGIK
ncbi:MAG: winged helix-turn-helix transcriptional regulator [Candidatus Aureabacteria bacterium]|nr:winged helix-turn-helix transcriptional regulator [Candidatus Auribacterota bacterium]